jgi:hypothetical protein
MEVLRALKALNFDSFAVVDGAIAIALLVVVPVRIAFLILAYSPILLDVV